MTTHKKHEEAPKAKHEIEKDDPRPASHVAKAAKSDLLTEFKGDVHNGPGVRCGSCGVVVLDGPEYDDRKKQHTALCAN